MRSFLSVNLCFCTIFQNAISHHFLSVYLGWLLRLLQTLFPPTTKPVLRLSTEKYLSFWAGLHENVERDYFVCSEKKCAFTQLVCVAVHHRRICTQSIIFHQAFIRCSLECKMNSPQEDKVWKCLQKTPGYLWLFSVPEKSFELFFRDCSFELRALMGAHWW